MFPLISVANKDCIEVLWFNTKAFITLTPSFFTFSCFNLYLKLLGLLAKCYIQIKPLYYHN